MFIIVLKKADLEKIYPQIFASEQAAREKLNDFLPDYTGYVLRAERV